MTYKIETYNLYKSRISLADMLIRSKDVGVDSNLLSIQVSVEHIPQPSLPPDPMTPDVPGESVPDQLNYSVSVSSDPIKIITSNLNDIGLIEIIGFETSDVKEMLVTFNGLNFDVSIDGENGGTVDIGFFYKSPKIVFYLKPYSYSVGDKFEISSTSISETIESTASSSGVSNIVASINSVATMIEAIDMTSADDLDGYLLDEYPSTVSSSSSNVNGNDVFVYSGRMAGGSGAPTDPKLINTGPTSMIYVGHSEESGSLEIIGKILKWNGLKFA